MEKHRIQTAAIALEGDIAGLPRGETGATSPASQAASIATKLDAFPHVPRQIVEALQTLPNRPVEISLSPEELGRVRLAVSQTEAGLTVIILTERAETLDLIRRQIHDLQAAFEAIGYSGAAFSFAQQGQSSDGGNAGDRGSEHDTGPRADLQDATQITLNAAPEGVDIRL